MLISYKINMKNSNLSIVKLILLLILSCAISCSDDDNKSNRNYQLVWQDEFDGSAGTSIDLNKWSFDMGRGPNADGWGNQELQYYSDRTDNVALDGNGNLAITAIKESFSGANYTSGRIKTQGLFDQAYGRFEARIKMPWGRGLWPAYWMLGSNITTVVWPQCGEIDVMENRGQEPQTIHGSVHGPGYSGGTPVTSTYTLPNDRFDQDFHVFAVEWGVGYIEYYVDNTLYNRITPDDVPGDWVYDHPFFLLLNVAVGGDFVGSPSDETVFPQTMLVDYVRVYQEVN